MSLKTTKRTRYPALAVPLWGVRKAGAAQYESRCTVKKSGGLGVTSLRATDASITML
ncbi:MAG: hypothetical protein OEM82_01590 [Acidobacteriota bacterium]|nr:hypothetical protein [Acidobacteriota bacterium]